MDFNPVNIFRKANSVKNLTELAQDLSDKTNAIRESITPQQQQLVASLKAKQLSLTEQLRSLSESGNLPDNYQELASQWTQDLAKMSQTPGGEPPIEVAIEQVLSEKSATITERLAAVEEITYSAGEAAEVAAGGALGAGVSYAMYQALKEFLSLEGARRRGDITNKAVVERVSKIAWEAAKKGAAVGAIFGIAVVIFGGWILVPLTIIAPFAGITMTMSLWQSFWNGLNEHQQQDLVDRANEVGGDISQFFNDLKLRYS